MKERERKLFDQNFRIAVNDRKTIGERLDEVAERIPECATDQLLLPYASNLTSTVIATNLADAFNEGVRFAAINIPPFDNGSSDPMSNLASRVARVFGLEESFCHNGGIKKSHQNGMLLHDHERNLLVDKFDFNDPKQCVAFQDGFAAGVVKCLSVTR